MCCVQPGEPFWKLYELYHIHDIEFDGVYLLALLRQAPKAIALFLVVAFGSCLDVAAIQADTPGQLDYNHELQTVGEFCTAAACLFELKALSLVAATHAIDWLSGCT